MSQQVAVSVGETEDGWQTVQRSKKAPSDDVALEEDLPPQPVERVLSSQSDVGRALALAALSWDNPKDLARESYQKKRAKRGKNTIRAIQTPVSWKNRQVQVSQANMSVPGVIQNGSSIGGCHKASLVGGYRYAPPAQLAQALGGSVQIMKTGVGRDAARSGIVTTQILVPGVQPTTVRIQETRGRLSMKAREGATSIRRVYSPDWVYGRQIHMAATKDAVNRALIQDGIATFRAERQVMGV
eukprot:CAMPEP_0204270048 /NCGR_PEP_ID=MMETSP0468-20130131/18032_1 /ASSEMBLY_ACC=CAM_ASM_000383 /TAXON_ID=2969 /ORGANISM="Oxyrrhis marina" /LENGTH=241 /DNA_ID=CAMNT_0051245535 /DNA_START=41 /DNA_END=766 /DNA_ORIENTATION=-